MALATISRKAADKENDATLSKKKYKGMTTVKLKMSLLVREVIRLSTTVMMILFISQTPMFKAVKHLIAKRKCLVHATSVQASCAIVIL